jgi:hypothetical protein
MMPTPLTIARYVVGFIIGLVWLVFFGPTTREEIQKYADDWMVS